MENFHAFRFKKKKQGYSESMLVRLQETSKYSAERQLYTLMDRLLDQKSLHAADIKMRINEIMTGKLSLHFL